ncbi:hypothetical protein ACJX0J_042438, partial [Zea mays]
EAQTGVVPSPIDVYRRGHRAKNSEISDELCSQAAVERMETYGQEMVKKYGEDYDWRGAPTIDAEVVHSLGGKAHGRYSMFTGVIDSTELRSRGGSSSQAGCGSSSRSRRSVSSMEEAMREQQEKFREDMRQQQMAFLQQQSEYMAAYNAQAQQAMNSWFPQQDSSNHLFSLNFSRRCLSGDYMLRHLHLHLRDPGSWATTRHHRSYQHQEELMLGRELMQE